MVEDEKSAFRKECLFKLKDLNFTEEAAALYGVSVERFADSLLKTSIASVHDPSDDTVVRQGVERSNAALLQPPGAGGMDLVQWLRPLVFLFIGTAVTQGFYIFRQPVIDKRSLVVLLGLGGAAFVIFAIAAFLDRRSGH